jgi:hypothetical protein
MKLGKAEIARGTASYDFRLLRAIDSASQAIILVVSHNISTSDSHGRGDTGHCCVGVKLTLCRSGIVVVARFSSHVS